MAQLQRRDLTFAETAPWRLNFGATIAATPAEVWATFIDNESWTRWFVGCRVCRGIGASFDGVGSRRYIEVSGLTVDEEFIAWEPEHLWAFTALDMKRAFATALVERATFTAEPDGRTRIDYRMAIAPTWWAKPFRRMLQSRSTKAFAASFVNLEREIASRR